MAGKVDKRLTHQMITTSPGMAATWLTKIKTKDIGRAQMSIVTMDWKTPSWIASSITTSWWMKRRVRSMIRCTGTVSMSIDCNIWSKWRLIMKDCLTPLQVPVTYRRVKISAFWWNRVRTQRGRNGKVVSFQKKTDCLLGWSNRKVHRKRVRAKSLLIRMICWWYEASRDWTLLQKRTLSSA